MPPIPDPFFAMKASDEQKLRLDLFRAAYKLVFGFGAERDEALAEISHLVFVLTHYNQKEETQCP